MYNALDLQESSRVKGCKDAHEIWVKLHDFHEGSLSIKEEKKSILVSKYESFKMNNNESIDDMFCRFNSIIKDLEDLGKIYPQSEINRKILSGLKKDYNTRAIAIETSKDLNILPLDALMSMLKIHEMRSKEEENTKNAKSIALKANKDESDLDNDSNDELGEEELNLLTRHFRKIFKKGNFTRKFKGEKPKCYGCQQTGHFLVDCPKKKKELLNKKRGKVLVANTWDQANSDDEDSNNEEEAQMAFMAHLEVTNSTPSSDDENEIDACSLLDLDDKMFVKYVESLASHLEKAKKKNVSLKSKVDSLKNENGLHVENLKRKDNEISELKKENAKLIKEKLSFNEKVKVEHKELNFRINDLSTSLAKFTQGRDNLEKLLGKQKVCEDKSGLGYSHSNAQASTSKAPMFHAWKYNEKYASKTSTPSYDSYPSSYFSFMPQKNASSFRPYDEFRKYARHRNYFVKHVKHNMLSSNFHLTCNYCGVFGHVSPRCYSRIDVENGLKVWRIKKSPNLQGPN